MDKRVKAAWLSVFSNITLMSSKFLVGFSIGSISVISEAIHSANDLVASFIALFAVKKSTEPPDERHPYGHGKIENVSGTIEALLIFIAAAMIINEAVKKIFKGGQIEALGWGIIVMGASALVNFFVSSYLLKVAKAEDSIALEADGMHLRTDVYTSLGVCVALVLIHFTGWSIIDPIAAILVALLIIKAAYDLTRKAFMPLVDTALDADTINIIESTLAEYKEHFVEYHKLRTRKAGRESHIDLHLVVSPYKSIQEAHDLCDKIENKIKDMIPYAHILIHVEPEINSHNSQA
ncbi:MAG TPA: cation diffusion facilitator family transporter [Syntrophomonadaceae bacterium]|nr:cation diffusion facilitator family transporter [Syntrophomonadaceae bacterium]